MPRKLFFRNHRFRLRNVRFSIPPLNAWSNDKDCGKNTPTMKTDVVIIQIYSRHWTKIVLAVSPGEWFNSLALRVTSVDLVGNGLRAVPGVAERYGARSLQSSAAGVLPWFEPCRSRSGRIVASAFPSCASVGWISLTWSSTMWSKIECLSFLPSPLLPSPILGRGRAPRRVPCNHGRGRGEGSFQS